MSEWTETRARVAESWQRQLSDAQQLYGFENAVMVEEHDNLIDLGIYMVSVRGTREDGSTVMLPLVYFEASLTP